MKKKESKQVQSSGNLLLRKMTMFSIIGFGDYADYAVQDLISMNNHAPLIKMYYGLSKIDFSDDVKEVLHITGDRVIPKPSKNWEVYYKNISKMIDEIIEDTKKKENDLAMMMSNNKNKKYQKNTLKNLMNMQTNKDCSKILNRNRNQGKWKK